MQQDLSEIYRSIVTLTEKVAGMHGSLTAEMSGIRKELQSSDSRAVESVRQADESRAIMHKRLNDVIDRIAPLESDMKAIKNQVADMQSFTDDVRKLGQQAQGAGTLGRGLVKIGIGVVAVAGWAIGLYTALTGKPPP